MPDGVGVRVLKLRPIGGAPEILADIFAKNVAGVPVIGRALARFVQWLAYALTRAGPGRRISEATSAVFPLGYFLVTEKPS